MSNISEVGKKDTYSDADTVILEVPSSSVSPRACDIPELKRTDSTFLTKTSLNLRSTSDESSIDSGDEYVPNSETDSEESESLSDNIDTSSSPVNADKECSPLGDKETTANLDSNSGSEHSVMKIKKTAYGQRMYNKKQYCFYCSKPFCKMARHLAQVHKNEVDVAKALSYPKGSKERRINLDLLRNKGNRAHNTDVLKSGKGVLVPRQQSSAKQVYVKDYVHCLNCQGLFRRKALWRHMSRCKLARMCQVTKPGRSRVQALCAYAEPVPEGVATKLWKLISDMKQDEVTCAVKSDACIIKFGEHLCNKMGNDKTKHEYIRIKMREAGRLLVSARKMGKLQSIKDFFIPANFHHVIKAVKETSRFRDEDEVFGIPSLALKLWGTT
ncbi:protein FAM171A1 isoform X1 [Labeo rohita]|uniref:Protein FAM171A1 isoform X1 n=1 Tax=Labeo rohita TaxID=84645 RepID=A0A498P267_LABRO|nr:protein FAM171A1 isoform X1 [Labeo rohita]